MQEFFIVTNKSLELVNNIVTCLVVLAANTRVKFVIVGQIGQLEVRLSVSFSSWISFRLG